MSEWNERLFSLRKRMQQSQNEFCGFLMISQPHLSILENHLEPSEKIKSVIEFYEDLEVEVYEDLLAYDDASSSCS